MNSQPTSKIKGVILRTSDGSEIIGDIDLVNGTIIKTPTHTFYSFVEEIKKDIINNTPRHGRVAVNVQKNNSIVSFQEKGSKVLFEIFAYPYIDGDIGLCNEIGREKKSISDSQTFIIPKTPLSLATE